MKLRDYDWQEQLDVEVEYPDGIVQDFINYLRRNKQWQVDPDMMYRRYLKFQRELTNFRNEKARADADGGCTAHTKSGRACKVTIGIEDGLCAIHRRALATV